MSQLHLFGIGNALVDVQYRVDEDLFSSIGLQRGGMQLVDAAEQNKVLERVQHLDAHIISGGSAANTVIAFAQFGGKAAYGTVLGADSWGDFYSQEFSRLGIELHAERSAEHPTGTCLILITPDAERTLNTSLAVNATFARHHIIEDAIRRADWLYIEGYKFSETNGAEAIEEAAYYAKKYDKKIAVTFSDAFIVNIFGSELRKTVEKADLVFCNEVEAKAFAGTDIAADAFKALKQAAPHVAMTLGDKGSMVYFDGAEYSVPSYAATPIDSTGAGDMYAAGFLYGITHGYSADKAGKIGSYAAARVVSQMGPRMSDSAIEEMRSALAGL